MPGLIHFMPNFHDEMLGFSALERTNSEKRPINKIDKILLSYSKYRGSDAVLHRLVVSQFDRLVALAGCAAFRAGAAA